LAEMERVCFDRCTIMLELLDEGAKYSWFEHTVLLPFRNVSVDKDGSNVCGSLRETKRKI